MSEIMDLKKGSIGIVVAVGGVLATAYAIKELSQRDRQAIQRRKIVERCERNARELAARISRAA